MYNPSDLREIQVPLKEILIKNLNQISKSKSDIGCFYMIKNRINGKRYIGKTNSFYQRMRCHISNANRNTGVHIDKMMYGNLNDFDFFILLNYKSVGINFFNRKLETIIEQDLIGKYESKFPNGYNIFTI